MPPLGRRQADLGCGLMDREFLEAGENRLDALDCYKLVSYHVSVSQRTASSHTKSCNNPFQRRHTYIAWHSLYL